MFRKARQYKIITTTATNVDEFLEGICCSQTVLECMNRICDECPPILWNYEHPGMPMVAFPFWQNQKGPDGKYKMTLLRKTESAIEFGQRFKSAITNFTKHEYRAKHQIAATQAIRSTLSIDAICFYVEPEFQHNLSHRTAGHALRSGLYPNQHSKWGNLLDALATLLLCHRIEF